MRRGHIVMPEVTIMAEMLDCLVSYFSEDANAEGMPHRYLSYHVVAGPGPSPEGGVASITPLAAYDENAICETCERVFAVKDGRARGRHGRSFGLRGRLPRRGPPSQSSVRAP